MLQSFRHVSNRIAHRWIWAAVVLGLALRAAFGLFYWVGKPLTHDEREYLALARSLSEGRGFIYEHTGRSSTERQFGRAPGYPAFLAILGAGRRQYDHSPARVKIAQAFVGAATVGIIGLIARDAAGPAAAIASAALAAVYPPLVWVNAYVLSESLYSAIALLAAYLLQRATSAAPTATREHEVPQGRVGTVAIAGALTGAAILVRPAMLLFVPLVALWFIGRNQLRVAVAFVLMTGAVVAPWTVRNAVVHGRFVLVASEGGVTFWTGNHPLARGEGDLSTNPELDMAEAEFRRAHPGLSAEELEPLYYRDALQSIAEQPLRWIALLLRKAFYTVVPVGPSYTLHSTRYWAASLLSYLLVLPFAIIGLGRLWRSERRPTAVLLLGASTALVMLVFFPQERFRIPVVDPVLIISAGPVLSAPRRPAGEHS